MVALPPYLELVLYQFKRLQGLRSATRRCHRQHRELIRSFKGHGNQFTATTQLYIM